MGATAPDFKPGEMLPGTKYRIVREIGAGGMGVVYQVVKPPEIMGVLKLMSSDLTGHQEFRTRFLDEVRVLAQLDHPNIVKVFDYDFLTDGTPFYVMELLHGRTVRDVLATMGTIPPRVAFEITRQLCEALHAAHTHDIPVVHRDIKPENIFLHAPRHGEPVVKLIDFGVVAVADRQHDGQFVGTWKYAAPEQIRGERGTPATDIYAVGLVLYEMLCGIGPFEGQDSGSLVSQAHLRDLPPPVSKFAPWVPPSIVSLIDASLAKNPRQRPRDAYAFAERLYELEWASDGKDPNERTAEGPLSRILSTVGQAKPSSKNLPAAAPKDRIGNVPVIGVPAAGKHDGPTLKGVGGQPHEPTSPGEDALLAGLLERAEVKPLSKRAREPAPVDARASRVPVVPLDGTPRLPQVVNRASNAPLEAPTLDALPSDPKVLVAATTDASFGDGTTRKLAPRANANANANDRDTFSSHGSDARHLPKGRSGKVVALVALAVIALLGAGTFAAYRTRGNSAAAAVIPGPPGEVRTAIGVTGAEMTATAPAASAAPSAASAPVAASAPASPSAGTKRRGTAPVAQAATAATAATAAPAVSTKAPVATPPTKPDPAKPDQTFDHDFH